MRVEFGNVAPIDMVNGVPTPTRGPAITIVSIRDTKDEEGNYEVGYIRGTQAADVALKYARNPGLVNRMGGNEVVANLTHSLWAQVSLQAPVFVNVIHEDRDPDDAADLARFLGDFFGCHIGRPSDIENTYYTQYGSTVYAPGECPTEE